MIEHEQVTKASPGPRPKAHQRPSLRVEGHMDIFDNLKKYQCFQLYMAVDAV
jgi:hypothetical protein